MHITRTGTDSVTAESLPLLTYCTNIHAGEEWTDLHRSLLEYVPQIRQQLGTAELGVGLRLGHTAIQALSSPENREALKEFLADRASLFTVNAFPFGAFHGEPVKQNVYEPDWSTTERLEYTIDVANLLADFALDQSDTGSQSAGFASISTVPGAFKPRTAGHEETIRSNLVKCVARLVDIKRETDRDIALALEPEPYCMLETIEETVRWFQEYAFSKQSCQQLAALTGTSASVAEDNLHQYLGVCYDVCHAAVEFEDAAQSFDALRSAGICIPKIQLSSALRVSEIDMDIATKLSTFDEPVYLHQVVQKDVGASSNSLTRFVDLPDAMKSLQSGVGVGSEWRVHFHVPVFLERLEHFDTTQFFLREVLDIVRRSPELTPHLEVETYTWDVLPESLRTSDISTAIAREMQWVLDELGCQPAYAAPDDFRESLQA